MQRSPAERSTTYPSVLCPHGWAEVWISVRRSPSINRPVPRETRLSTSLAMGSEQGRQVNVSPDGGLAGPWRRPPARSDVPLGGHQGPHRPSCGSSRSRRDTDISCALPEQASAEEDRTLGTQRSTASGRASTRPFAGNLNCTYSRIPPSVPRETLPCLVASPTNFRVDSRGADSSEPAVSG